MFLWSLIFRCCLNAGLSKLCVCSLLFFFYFQTKETNKLIYSRNICCTEKYYNMLAHFHYENTPIQRILSSKNENFQMKNSGSFHTFAQNIDCGYLLELPRRGCSNKYPQSMFLSRNKKINEYPCKVQFYYIK